MPRFQDAGVAACERTVHERAAFTGDLAGEEGVGGVALFEMVPDCEFGEVERRSVEYGHAVLVEQLRGQFDVGFAIRRYVVEHRFDFRSREGQRSVCAHCLLLPSWSFFMSAADVARIDFKCS